MGQNFLSVAHNPTKKALRKNAIISLSAPPVVVQRTQLHLAIGKYLVIVSCFMGETETRKPAVLRPKLNSAKWKFSA